MKTFLLLIDAQKGFLVDGVTEEDERMVNTLLESHCFDCVISSVYQNREGSHIIRFMGWDKLLTEQEQQVTDTVSAHADHFVYKHTYSAYSDELVEILKSENDGELPECVFVAGFDLECCVLMTATDLFEHGIRPIVLTKYCGASGGEEAKHAGVRTLKSLIGANNISDDTIGVTADPETIIRDAQNAIHVSSEPSQKKAEKLIAKLNSLGRHIAFAESCTGGKATAGIVDIPSASSVLDASFVTYANAAKSKFVNVSPDTLREHGAVSEEVAAEMAVGAAKAASAEVGVGISGIAGPDGGSERKPVGMVCFGFFVDGKTYTETRCFGNIGRGAVRQASVDFVYDTLLRLLDDASSCV